MRRLESGEVTRATVRWPCCTSISASTPSFSRSPWINDFSSSGDIPRTILQDVPANQPLLRYRKDIADQKVEPHRAGEKVREHRHERGHEVAHHLLLHRHHGGFIPP